MRLVETGAYTRGGVKILVIACTDGTYHYQAVGTDGVITDMTVASERSMRDHYYAVARFNRMISEE